MREDMPKIIHESLFDTDKIAKLYSEKDGVDVKYVCTSALGSQDFAVDVFYRATPHPEFGNRYFGLYISPTTSDLMITNADKVEDLEFGMITDRNGDYWYSQSHHDCLHIDGKMIDGGRAYIRHSGEAELWKVKDGEMVRTVYSVEENVV